VTIGRLASVGAAGLFAVLSLLNLILSIKRMNEYEYPGAEVASVSITILLATVGLALIAYGFVRRSEVARTIAITAGAITLATTLIDWTTDWDLSNGGIESVHLPVFFVLPFVAVGAIALSEAVKAHSAVTDPATRWVRAASTTLFVGAAIALAQILSTILSLVADYGLSGGKGAGYIVVLLVLAVVTAAGGFLARTAYGNQKVLVFTATGFALILGIVAAVLYNSLKDMTILTAIQDFGVPVAVFLMLLVPTSMRSTYGGISLPAAAVAPAAPVPPVAPTAPPAPMAPPAAATPPAPVAAPAAHPRSAEAANPATSAAALHEIATTIPELRAVVAANPSTYPDLLTWLGQLGDPAINAAIAARG